MILEAFSDILKLNYPDENASAKAILDQWILAILTTGRPTNSVERVIHSEFALLISGDETVILPRSKDAERLLTSLTQYCESYEHWMFRRWLHQAKASHFAS